MAQAYEATIFYIGVLVPISIIAPISLAFLKYKQLPPELKIITLCLCCSGLSNLLSTVSSHLGINNMPLVHLYSVVEFGVICMFYRKILLNENIRKYIPVLFLFFLLICIVNALFFQTIFSYSTYTKPIEAIFVILLSIVYLLQLLEDYDKVIAHKTELIYINSGFLLYFSGSFVLFTIFNIFVNNKDVAFAILDVHATILLLMYTSFTIALWKFKK